MQTISTIGLDIAKSVFQVQGVDATGGKWWCVGLEAAFYQIDDFPRFGAQAARNEPVSPLADAYNVALAQRPRGKIVVRSSLPSICDAGVRQFTRNKKGAAMGVEGQAAFGPSRHTGRRLSNIITTTSATAALY